MKNIDYLKNKVSILINLYQSKQFEEITIKGRALINEFPNQEILINITSLAFSAIGKHTEARELLKKFLKKEPDNHTILNNLGLVSTSMGENEEAENFYIRALEAKSDFIDSLINLGNLKNKQNKTNEAKKYFLQALKINNNLEQAKISLAAHYDQVGDFDEAKKLYNEILENNPNNTLADKSLSLIHKYEKGDPHILKMEDKISQTTNVEDVKRLSFALGKAYEDTKEYDKSFKFYKSANDIQNENINYNIQEENNLFKNIKKTFDTINLEPQKNLGQKIIFIVGMPRSGTTLIEQILSSHQNVYGAGELSFLTEVIENNLLIKDKNLNNYFHTPNDEILKKMQMEYLEKVKIFKNQKHYLIDKAPLNFRWIGFIKLLFPNSKIIHCNRDPMDICWSNYKNSFASKLQNYSYSFEALSNYYNLYYNLMNFWSDKLNVKIYNIIYENLILEKEIEIKKLLNFCELDWDENCLQFHNNKKAVSTASLAQIRQPLYSSSVKKWKNYFTQLNDLEKKLKI